MISRSFGTCAQMWRLNAILYRGRALTDRLKPGLQLTGCLNAILRRCPVVAITFLLLSVSLPNAHAQVLTDKPDEIQDVGIEPKLNDPVPLNLAFRDENGFDLTLKQYFQGERPVILCLHYSDCPMLCTLVLNGMVDSLRELTWTPGKEFEVVCVSIDPLEQPKRAKLTKAKYVGNYGRPETAGGWHFLTGSEANIKRLADAVGFKYRYVPEQKEFAHVATLILCTPDGRVSRYLQGVMFAPRTMKLSLLEAGEGKVGSTFDQVLLYCFHYDAEEGAYGPVARNIMKLGAGMTMAVVLIGLIPYWLRRQHRNAPSAETSSQDTVPESPAESAPEDAGQGGRQVTGESDESGSSPLANIAFLLGGPLAAPGGSMVFPQRASTDAAMVDNIFYFILWVSIVFFVIIVGVMVLFVFKYRRREGVEAVKTATHSNALEAFWSIIPSILVAVMFIWGFLGYMQMRTAPDNAYEIQVLAKKWVWSFEYPNGYIDPNLHVPVDRPVRLVMSSDDVIHSLYIPVFRLKMDVVPGRYNKTWFQATEVNDDEGYDLFCAEYCGTQHSTMLAKVFVHKPGEFDKWLADAANFLDRMTPAEGGQVLYNNRGCAQCHSMDGSARAGGGPSFKDTFGTEQPMVDGSKVVVDEDYVRQSILEPQAKIRAGYDPRMPTYQGQLKEEEIRALIAFLKSLTSNYQDDSPEDEDADEKAATDDQTDSGPADGGNEPAEDKPDEAEVTRGRFGMFAGVQPLGCRGQAEAWTPTTSHGMDAGDMQNAAAGENQDPNPS